MICWLTAMYNEILHCAIQYTIGYLRIYGKKSLDISLNLKKIRVNYESNNTSLKTFKLLPQMVKSFAINFIWNEWILLPFDIFEAIDMVRGVYHNIRFHRNSCSKARLKTSRSVHTCFLGICEAWVNLVYPAYLFNYLKILSPWFMRFINLVKHRVLKFLPKLKGIKCKKGGDIQIFLVNKFGKSHERFKLGL